MPTEPLPTDPMPAGPGPSITAPAPLLELRTLSVRFGGVFALSNIDLAVHAGEFVGIIGPNGAGKSTLLNALSGLVRTVQGGSIRFAGAEADSLKPAARAVRGIGRSFQDPPLVESEDALTNVAGGAHLNAGYGALDQLLRRRRVTAAEATVADRAREVMEFVGLDDVGDAPVSSLPYGSRKLVDIARALMSRPQLLLLDEPSSGLDHHELRNVVRILTELRRAGDVTALFVEHHMDVVRAGATRVVALQAGEILAVGTPTEVLDSEQFREAIVGTVASSTTTTTTTASASSDDAPAAATPQHQEA